MRCVLLLLLALVCLAFPSATLGEPGEGEFHTDTTPPVICWIDLPCDCECVCGTICICAEACDEDLDSFVAMLDFEVVATADADGLLCFEVDFDALSNAPHALEFVAIDGKGESIAECFTIEPCVDGGFEIVPVTCAAVSPSGDCNVKGAVLRDPRPGEITAAGSIFGVPNVVVNLTLGAGGPVIATATTNADGNFIFWSVDCGADYVLTPVLPAGSGFSSVSPSQQTVTMPTVIASQLVPPFKAVP